MTFCAARVPVLALVLALLAGPVGAGKRRALTNDDLLNVLLGPSYAQWLVGAVSQIATEEELRSYLRLTDDDAAREFIDAFWQARVESESPWPGSQLRDLFDTRATEADRLFSEGINLGRRTDRGTTFVLFGPPLKRTYVQEPGPRGRTVEIWLYGRDAQPGLGGQRPREEYFFTRQGDVTEFTQRPRKLSAVPDPRLP